MDDNKDRFTNDGPSPQVAGDELVAIAADLKAARDALLALAKRAYSLNAEVVGCLAGAEDWIIDLIGPTWNRHQEVLAAASERELDEADTTCMGEAMPTFFRDATPDSVRALNLRLRPVQTNPATHKDIGLPL